MLMHKEKYYVRRSIRFCTSPAASNNKQNFQQTLAEKHLFTKKVQEINRTHLMRRVWVKGFWAQAGRCFQVLTKAVGMREYGTVVMLFQASNVGS